VLLRELQIKNFRCFESKVINLNSKIVLIEGENGVGKSSILEALHYLCYLRSFRTYAPKELIHFESDNFFLKVVVENALCAQDELKVGFSGKKKTVKINEVAVPSFRELFESYRIITVTDDDLSLIKGTPEERRAFLDQFILLCAPEYLDMLKKFKHILDSRNALLASKRVSRSNYDIWTKQLWESSIVIQRFRADKLRILNDIVSDLVNVHFGEEITIELGYKVKKGSLNEDFDGFLQKNHELFDLELRFERSCFGAHLDDISIIFKDQKSKQFASRGQQKLILLLLKVAQVKNILAQKGGVIFLLDDVMSDFDEKVLKTILDILIELDIQLILTSPVVNKGVEKHLPEGILKKIQI